MLHITGLFSRREMDRIERERDKDDALDAYISSQTRKAERGLQAPESLPAGMDPLELAKGMSWDFTQGWRSRKARQLRESRSRGVHMPIAFLQHEDGSVERVYETDDLDMEPFRNGECCVRCHNWQPEDEHIRREKHRRLSDMTGYQIPVGLKPRDCCCYCGALLRPDTKG